MRAFHSERPAFAGQIIIYLVMRYHLTLTQALKLAERAIQFADTLTVLTDGYLRAGRVSHSQRANEHAEKCYSAALGGQPKNIVAAIGMAQMQLW